MRTTRFVLIAAIAGCAAFFSLSQVGQSRIGNQPESGAALTGRVTSAEEGPMEGVLVTAKKTESTDRDYGRDR